MVGGPGVGLWRPVRRISLDRQRQAGGHKSGRDQCRKHRPLLHRVPGFAGHRSFRIGQSFKYRHSDIFGGARCSLCASIQAGQVVRAWAFGSGAGLSGLVSAAFAIRSFLFQPFSIPASSMVPTLEVGDYLFASKFAYGYSRHSVPFGLLPIAGRTFDTAPALGDIAVFRRPSDPSTDYIKRIVGLPGDKIQMIDGVLHINDHAVKLEETGSYSSDEIRSAKVQRETLQNGVSYSVLDVIDGSTGDNTQPVVVPAGRYFMLGDNRDSSADSRFDMGTIPYENLVGKGVRLFWNSRGVDYSSRSDRQIDSSRRRLHRTHDGARFCLMFSHPVCPAL
ncbi:signal peptidase I [Mesorhizobium sp. M5C.F.Ca.IN.020.29.1.1]|uniref:signal peptidase I n=1 Tax=unclassified Mesorhizobium TaxID=325217 RepID=UPI000FCB1759|nr:MULTISPECIES: signal peptidase I [unclassified Mesorhizobium]RUV55188.1 signal peptidase I [Mesorhizobium sp. M5C.F.Ca.IN.020.29.1.1]TIM86173.1 MAG: signal peptidase I [Mesorhizobium sp.]